MPLTGMQLESSLSNRRLHLVLLPTEACNCRCVYCYESFRLKRMEPWVVRGVKALLRRRAAGLDSLTISWFGGEPLLEPGIITDVMEEVARLREARPEMSFVSDITTNAYLMPGEMAGRLLDVGVSQFQISFDGPKEFHDQRRVLHGGKPTFERIWANLRALQAHDRAFSATIRLHADRQNEPALPTFLDAFAEQFGADPRFEIFPRLLSRFGGPNDANLTVFDREEGQLALERIRAQAEARGIRVVPKSTGTVVCYAAKANSFLIRSDGHLSKCTIALDQPHNRVGRLREDGTLDLEQPTMLVWMRGLKSRDDKELHCPMHGFPAQSLALGVAS